MAKWYDSRYVSMLTSKEQLRIRTALENKGYKGTALLDKMFKRLNELADVIDIAKIMGYDKKPGHVCVIADIREEMYK